MQKELLQIGCMGESQNVELRRGVGSSSGAVSSGGAGGEVGGRGDGSGRGDYYSDTSRTPGFTLIELLIVMSIMALLTLVAMGSFNGVQRQARVSFAADTLVATLREAEVLAKSGRTVGVAGSGSTVSEGATGGTNSAADAAGKLQCFAVRIKARKMEDTLAQAQSNYIGLGDVGEGSAGGIDTCTVLENSSWRTKDVFDSEIIVKSIKEVGSTDAPDEQQFYFKPPFGQAYLVGDDGLKVQSNQVFEYVVGVADRTDLDATVRFDVSTGEVKKVLNTAPAA